MPLGRHARDGRADARAGIRSTAHPYEHDPRAAAYGSRPPRSSASSPPGSSRRCSRASTARSRSGSCPSPTSSTSRRSRRRWAASAPRWPTRRRGAEDGVRRRRHQPDRAEGRAADGARRDRDPVRRPCSSRADGAASTSSSRPTTCSPSPAVATPPSPAPADPLCGSRSRAAASRDPDACGWRVRPAASRTGHRLRLNPGRSPILLR